MQQDLPPKTYEIESSVSQELSSHLGHYRKLLTAWLDSKSRLQTVELIRAVEHLQDYLERNRSEIFMTIKNNGWPSYREKGMPLGSGYQVVFNSLMRSCTNFLASPNVGSAHMINEQLTQLLWLARIQNT